MKFYWKRDKISNWELLKLDYLNLMARAWNSSTELQTVTTIWAAKSVALKWAIKTYLYFEIVRPFLDGHQKNQFINFISLFTMTCFEIKFTNVKKINFVEQTLLNCFCKDILYYYQLLSFWKEYATLSGKVILHTKSCSHSL